MFRMPLRAALFASTLLVTVPAHAEHLRYSVVSNGEKVGFVDADVQGNRVAIEYDVKNNGRGPTMRETVELGRDELPTRWELDGKATFGGDVHERFAREGSTVRWTDSMGEKQAVASGPALYVGQNASPWALGLYARALLKDADGRMAAFPGGELAIEKLGPAIIGKVRYQAYSISGIDLSPEMILLDGKGELFATLDSGGGTVREGMRAKWPPSTNSAPG
ncbi:hypothetical protein ACFSLT_22490 [Novosphingobium resinovorum]